MKKIALIQTTGYSIQFVTTAKQVQKKKILLVFCRATKNRKKSFVSSMVSTKKHFLSKKEIKTSIDDLYQKMEKSGCFK